MSIYDPAVGYFLDWMVVLGFVSITGFVLWQILTRSQLK